MHGILLSGGSAFGLAAADGVMRYLAEHGHGLAFGGNVIPIVPGAILFDLGIGTKRAPDSDAGYRAASRASHGRVEEGSVGAGTGATVAKLAGGDRALKGGLGTASERLDVGVVVGAIAAVNSVGAIRDPRTGEVVAAPRADDGGFVDIDAHLRTGRAWPELVKDDEDEGEAPGPETPTNTTLAVVATNAKLSREQANRLATVCHDGFARTIWPAHCRGDGDAIFSLATGEVEVDPYAYSALEAMATRAVERAVLRGVRRATGLAGVPSASEWRAQPSS